MPIVAETGDIIEVRMYGRHDGQVVITVLHYILDIVDETPTLGSVIDDIYSNLTGVDKLGPKYAACVSEDYTGWDCQIQRIFPTRSAFVAFDPVVAVGLVAAASLPPGNSVAVTKRSELAGRSKVGGVRMPCVAASWNVDGEVGPTFLPAYTDLGDKIKVPGGQVIFSGDRLEALALMARLGHLDAGHVGGTSTSGDRGTSTSGDGGTSTPGEGRTAA